MFAQHVEIVAVPMRESGRCSDPFHRFAAASTLAFMAVLYDANRTISSWLGML